jgi:hypothetical protein
MPKSGDFKKFNSGYKGVIGHLKNNADILSEHHSNFLKTLLFNKF